MKGLSYCLLVITTLCRDEGCLGVFIFGFLANDDNKMASDIPRTECVEGGAGVCEGLG